MDSIFFFLWGEPVSISGGGSKADSPCLGYCCGGVILPFLFFWYRNVKRSLRG
jgi:hypothetical protein